MLMVADCHPATVIAMARCRLFLITMMFLPGPCWMENLVRSGQRPYSTSGRKLVVVSVVLFAYYLATVLSSHKTLQLWNSFLDVLAETRLCEFAADERLGHILPEWATIVNWWFELWEPYPVFLAEPVPFAHRREHYGIKIGNPHPLRTDFYSSSYCLSALRPGV
jgi:hypothetical protein